MKDKHTTSTARTNGNGTLEPVFNDGQFEPAFDDQSAGIEIWSDAERIKPAAAWRSDTGWEIDWPLVEAMAQRPLIDFGGMLQVSVAVTKALLFDRGIRKAPLLTWREDAIYVGGIYAGEVEQRWLNPTEKERRWRAWIMGTTHGRSLGFYSTAEEARAALYAAVCKELGYEG